jgi:hypothetical protein
MNAQINPRIHHDTALRFRLQPRVGLFEVDAVHCNALVANAAAIVHSARSAGEIEADDFGA